MRELLQLDRPHRRGDRGEKAQLIQEWLTLRGFAVGIDGDFGAATEGGVERFQRARNLPVTGVVDAATFARLVAPMKTALRRIPPNGRSLGELVVAYAEQHLKQRPREIGGQNRGPWVRLYSGGREEAWCAHFVSFCVGQACETLGIQRPFPATGGCDELAGFAGDRRRLLSAPAPARRERLAPGTIFLRRSSPRDWTHTGFLTAAERERFHTIEGNSNDEGSREGYEVCAGTRGYRKDATVMDFVRL